LLIALSVTAVLVLAIASMLHAVAYGSQSQSSARQTNVASKLLRARIDAAIAGAKMVLATDNSTYIVIWTGDTNADSVPDLSELRRIEFNAGTGQITSYRAPAGVTPDTAYTLATDFNATTNALKGGNTFPAEVWAKNVTAFSASLNNGTTQNATAVYYSVTAQNGSTASNAAAGTSYLRTQ
jgi:hypothetical protein